MSAHERAIQRISPLEPEQLEQLLRLQEQLGMYPKKLQRMGGNGIANPSQYETNSLFKLSSAKHLEVLSHIPNFYSDKSVVRYFIRYPAGYGQLDLQTTWLNEQRPMTIVGWSLNDGNEILVREKIPQDAREEVRLKVGNLAYHSAKDFEIITSANREKWRFDKTAKFQTRPVKHVFNKGEGFAMCLSLVHEIHSLDFDQNWFCLGIMPGGLE